MLSSGSCSPHRSIYPDEFDNFVERMRVVSNSKSKKFLFEVDVMDSLLNVVLDTNLGADLSRDRYSCHVPGSQFGTQLTTTLE